MAAADRNTMLGRKVAALARSRAPPQQQELLGALTDYLESRRDFRLLYQDPQEHAVTDVGHACATAESGNFFLVPLAVVPARRLTTLRNARHPCRASDPRNGQQP